MNKKFSTLVAGMLLATTVGTGYAQTQDVYTKATAPSIEAVSKVTDGRAYQLSDGYNVLVMQKVKDLQGGGFHYELAFIPYFQANIGESLWTVEKDSNVDKSRTAFIFRNLAHHLTLSFDPAKAQDYKGGVRTASHLGGKDVSWTWMLDEAGENLTIARTPETYIHADSIMTLLPASDGSGKVAAVKYATKDVQERVDFFRIKPVVAGPVWLSKYDLNSKLQTQADDKVAFAFAKGVSEGMPNKWVEQEYEAVDAKPGTLSYGEVADAYEAYEKAYAVYEAKVKQVDAALEALNSQKEDYAVTAKMLKDEQGNYNDLVKQLQTVSVSLRGHQYELKDLNKKLQSIEESIKNNANINDEQKKKIEGLHTDLVHAVDALEEAQALVNTRNDEYDAANRDVMAATEAWSLALSKKNVAYQKDELAKTYYSTVKSTSSLNSVELSLFNTAYLDDTKAWNDFLAIVGITTESDRELFLEFAKGLYDSAMNAGIQATSSIRSNINSTDAGLGKVTNDYVTSINEAYEAAEQKAEDADTELVKCTTAVNESVAKKAEAEEALKEAKTAESKARTAYITVKNSIIHNNELDKDLLALLNRLEDQKSELEATIAEEESQEATLRKACTTSIDRILALSQDLEFDKGDVIYHMHKWALADRAAAKAARTAQGLYAVYTNLNAVKTPYWLSLKADNGKYLMVDTAYLSDEVAGQNHLTFNTREYKKFENPNAPLAARDINGRFNFRFLYFPTQDSLRIEADGYNQKDVTTANWKDRDDSEIRYRASFAPGFEQNLVKVAVLGKHREVTVGSSEYIKRPNALEWTINDRIGLSLAGPVNVINVPAGLYYLDIVKANTQENGARLMLDVDGYSLTKVTPADQGKMDFTHMPAAKWYVGSTPTDFGGYPNIYNMETGEKLNLGAYTVEEKDGKYYVTIRQYIYQGYVEEKNDTFVLSVAPESEEGYYRTATEDPRALFTLNYLNISSGLNVEVGDKTINNDSVLVVSANSVDKFRLHRVGNNQEYGYGNSLERGLYQISLYNPNKLNKHNKYVQITNVDGTEMMVVSDAASATNFYLKEVNDVDGTHYYALIDAAWDKKAGVVDATGLIKAEDITAETRTSSFALVVDSTRYYREFTKDELGEKNMLKFYRTRSTDKEYLYASEATDLNLLAVEGKGDNADALAEMTVIPTTETGVLMPQYFIGRNVTEQKGSVKWCGEDHASLADSLACVHTHVTPDTIFGNFLVNLKIDAKYNKYDWENKYTRLAFLKGYVVKEEGTMPGTGNYTKLFVDGKQVTIAENKHNAAKFEFRLINDDEAQDFLIESESWKNDNAFAGAARPMTEGGWLKVQNGVPVIVKDNFENFDASSADIYNVESSEGSSVANEDITTSTIAVIGGKGTVTVKGAEGKKVVINNVLGQVVVNTVITSSEATIAVPAGVVYVTVEGETAVPAIVK